ncbi:MAG: DNA repair protein RecN [Alphaproteobacteria bacterium]|nr:DNA repair protein RecN [Alphaproteobacteria bacterium]
MLAGLSIRDVVIIDRLDLNFGPGLNVLTGETGAGKSILLDALGLALGERSDQALIRQGAAQAVVSAEFDVASGDDVHAVLAEYGLPSDGPLVLRRVLGRDGRARAFVNDHPTSVAMMRRIGEALVEVQGQFEQRGLLNPATHRQVLDAFAGHAPLVAATRETYAVWREAEAALAEAEKAMAEAAADEEYLRHSLEELERIGPEPGEEAKLAEQRATLMNREKLVDALDRARGEVAGGRSNGVEDALHKAQAHLERAGDEARRFFAPIIEILDRAAAEASEATRALQTASVTIEGEAGNLEDIEERLFALREIARKHRVQVEQLPALHEAIAGKLVALEDQSGSVAGLKTALFDARAAYIAAAEELSDARRAAAERLDAAVAHELPPLKLETARFRTVLAALDEADWGPDGYDRIEFEIATNPGAATGPLRKIASGGELARFMLALKVVLAQANPVPTLVFDEVDAGIGGATAAAVGDRLDRLAGGVQVLVVTHSPQVAARGAHHWRVSKAESGAAVMTQVDALATTTRREEIARMLSGRDVTDEARAAADRLIAGERP